MEKGGWIFEGCWLLVEAGELLTSCIPNLRKRGEDGAFKFAPGPPASFCSVKGTAEQAAEKIGFHSAMGYRIGYFA